MLRDSYWSKSFVDRTQDSREKQDRLSGLTQHTALHAGTNLDLAHSHMWQHTLNLTALHRFAENSFNEWTLLTYTLSPVLEPSKKSILSNITTLFTILRKLHLSILGVLDLFYRMF